VNLLQDMLSSEEKRVFCRTSATFDDTEKNIARAIKSFNKENPREPFLYVDELAALLYEHNRESVEESLEKLQESFDDCKWTMPY
jgi:hypothetical protein